MSKNIGFVSFRLAGTDGVTLETFKWASAFERIGYKCFFCAGELSTPSEVSMVFPEMHFNTEDMQELMKECFSRQDRPQSITSKIHDMRKTIKKQLYEFINSYEIDVLVPQNVLAIPMNLPLSMALVEVIAETRIHAIAHHHDFYWERERYRINGVQDILMGCIPPNLANINHVVINKPAQSQLAFRCGISSTIVPNVMDFANPPVGKDEYNESVRKDLGLDDDTFFILQPTRIVQRKGIEHTIEIARRIGRKCTIIISHESGDEGGEYKQRVLEFADMLGVDVKMTAESVGEVRSTTADGKKIYNLNDVYAYADLVTYPSIIEGFGNALLETFYFKKPIIVNTYPVYVTDIKPRGFKAVEFVDFVSDATIKKLNGLLENQGLVDNIVEMNYSLANKYFSYELLEKKILALIRPFYGV